MARTLAGIRRLGAGCSRGVKLRRRPVQHREGVTMRERAASKSSEGVTRRDIHCNERARAKTGS